MWIYGKQNTLKYLRKIDEFVECALKDMRNRGAQTLILFLSRLLKLTEISIYRRSERSFDLFWI
jgi:hypothetical protein